MNSHHYNFKQAQFSNNSYHFASAGQYQDPSTMGFSSQKDF